jgi:hypothetical protein
LHDLCRNRWAYLIPDNPHDRQRLRDLCARILEFENHHLSIRRTYLLNALRTGSPSARLAAARTLGGLLFPDQEIRDTLHAALGAVEAAGAAEESTVLRTPLQRGDAVRS